MSCSSSTQKSEQQLLVVAASVAVYVASQGLVVHDLEGHFHVLHVDLYAITFKGARKFSQILNDV